MAARIVRWSFVLGLFTAAGISVAAAQQSAAPNRQPLADSNSDEDRILAALDTITDISLTDASLEGVAAWIRKQFGI